MKTDYILIVLAGILWGGIALFVNVLDGIGFTSIEIVALRVWFSAIVIGIVLTIKNKRLPVMHIRDIGLFIGTGIVSIVAFNFCYFTTIQLSGVSVAALLLYTAPTMVMLISVPVLHEKLNVQKVVSLLVVCLGLLFITGVLGSKETVTGKAVLFGLGSGLGYALYSIFGKFLVKKYDAYTITFYTFVFAAMGVLPFVSVPHVLERLVSLKGISASLGIATLCTVAPFICYTTGLKKVESSKASILATIEPLVASLVGIIVLKEAVSLHKVLGMGLILMAVVILNLNFNKKIRN
ncbi:MAG TPA: EamA family transporter [Lachnospiraceae bacterium]|nr:EamA family transporter [uncultured Lachnoclostridium sp.]HAU88471.1 EamA family transporter [Lachnospiraceae bacterium]